MRTYAVWAEGYSATGNDGPARKIGEVEASSFSEACALLCSDPDWQIANGRFDPERLTVWGCRLFETEAEARRQFG